MKQKVYAMLQKSINTGVDAGEGSGNGEIRGHIRKTRVYGWGFQAAMGLNDIGSVRGTGHCLGYSKFSVLLLYLFILASAL